MVKLVFKEKHVITNEANSLKITARSPLQLSSIQFKFYSSWIGVLF